MQEGGEQFVELPDFSFGAATEFGWVENDAVVVRAPAGFTLYKFQGVVQDPADRAVFQVGKGLVFTRPADDFALGVQVGDFGAGVRGGQAGDAGVAE
jgi:hypothetical protein